MTSQIVGHRRRRELIEMAKKAKKTKKATKKAFKKVGRHTDTGEFIVPDRRPPPPPRKK